MALYTIRITTWYEVEADSEEDAIEAASFGEGEVEIETEVESVDGMSHEQWLWAKMVAGKLVAE